MIEAILTCTSADNSVPPPEASALLMRCVKEDTDTKYDCDLVMALITELCRCMEEGEPQLATLESGSLPAAVGSSYRFMKAMLLTSQLLQQCGAGTFSRAAKQRLLPVLQQQLATLEAALPDPGSAAAGGVPRTNLQKTGQRLLQMLQTGMSSVVNTGEFHVKARTRHTSDIYLSPGQTVRWRFKLAKHDIGLEISSNDIGGATLAGPRQRDVIHGPLKLSAKHKAFEGEFSVDRATRATVGSSAVADAETRSSGQKVTFAWDNSYSKLNSKTIQYEMEIISALGVVAPANDRSRAAAAAATAADKYASLPPIEGSNSDSDEDAEEGAGEREEASAMKQQQAAAVIVDQPFAGGTAAGASGDGVEPEMLPMKASGHWGRARAASMGMLTRPKSNQDPSDGSIAIAGSRCVACAMF